MNSKRLLPRIVSAAWISVAAIMVNSLSFSHLASHCLLRTQDRQQDDGQF